MASHLIVAEIDGVAEIVMGRCHVQSPNPRSLKLPTTLERKHILSKHLQQIHCFYLSIPTTRSGRKSITKEVLRSDAIKFYLSKNKKRFSPSSM